MDRVAFVFPGQGAQHAGMGKLLQEGSAAAAEVFCVADSVCPGTSKLCFEGPEEALAITANTQVCMFAVELAAAMALKERGVQPVCAAGFSLGEVAALTFSGAVDLETGFRLVKRRGELMQRDAEKTECAMAAVVKLPPETVEKLCAGFEGVYPVNYNGPGQVSVAGRKEPMVDFAKAVKDAGGRAIPIRVKGGFHCAFMADAAEAFGRELEQVCFTPPQIPLYSDYTAQVYGQDFPRLLSMQIKSPVRWQALVENMLASGVKTFVEVGPGKTLCGLISRIDANARVLNVEDLESLEKTVTEVGA